jgi:hypothetical protein
VNDTDTAEALRLLRALASPVPECGRAHRIAHAQHVQEARALVDRLAPRCVRLYLRNGCKATERNALAAYLDSVIPGVRVEVEGYDTRTRVATAHGLTEQEAGAVADAVPSFDKSWAWAVG